MKVGVILCCLIAVAWVALALAQLWFMPLDAALFIKISITAGLLFIVVLVLSLVLREYLTDRKLKDSGHLDG